MSALAASLTVEQAGAAASIASRLDTGHTPEELVAIGQRAGWWNAELVGRVVDARRIARHAVPAPSKRAGGVSTSWRSACPTTTPRCRPRPAKLSAR